MRPLILAAVWTFVIDQVSKLSLLYLVDLPARGEIDVIPPLLNFRMAWNYGINFGLFSGQTDLMRWLLVAIAVAISLGVAWWAWRERPGRFGAIGAGLLIGGALGNALDRVLHGAVVDFLNMSCCGIENPYAFNIADIGIFAGALALVFVPSGKKGA